MAFAVTRPGALVRLFSILRLALPATTVRHSADPPLARPLAAAFVASAPVAPVVPRAVDRLATLVAREVVASSCLSQGTVAAVAARVVRRRNPEDVPGALLPASPTPLRARLPLLPAGKPAGRRRRARVTAAPDADLAGKEEVVPAAALHPECHRDLRHGLETDCHRPLLLLVGQGLRAAGRLHGPRAAAARLYRHQGQARRCNSERLVSS
mmetsp:Transcript_149456/g.416538  ORF Transcript_149456/g.416538 Transcript_149456/m.416538 type:complete len:211 (-) Transcript_149456:858-1490(-)